MALIIKIILNTLMGPTRAIICPAHGRNTIAVNMYAPITIPITVFVAPKSCPRKGINTFKIALALKNINVNIYNLKKGQAIAPFIISLLRMIVVFLLILLYKHCHFYAMRLLEFVLLFFRF